MIKATSSKVGWLGSVIFMLLSPVFATPPTWSDEFNGTGAPDPNTWSFESGYIRNNELQYYQADNAWQEGGNLIIEARRNDNGHDYTSSSIRSDDKYSFKYGRMQVRAKIPVVPGSWPAIWTLGDVGQWPHNGECDVLEYKGTATSPIFANCARGTNEQWVAAWDAVQRPTADFRAWDPHWDSEYHIWTMQWDEDYVRLYVDNVLMNETAQTWLVNTTTTWGPLEPFKQPHKILLNLAIGAGGGDPTNTPFPIRYLVDYVRVWENYTSNATPTDIALTSSNVVSAKPVGEVVGYLSATDADPAEVIRYELVSGTGDTDNADFDVHFVSDSTTTSVLKTKSILDYADGATRSIRVRAIDIEGASYDEVVTINVEQAKLIEVQSSPIAVAEGGSSTFSVRLSRLPAADVTVNVSRTSGDSDLSITSATALTFTTTNATDWQHVTISAADDVDHLDGVATFSFDDPSSTYNSLSVDAAEVDDDNDSPLVDAGADLAVVMSGSSAWTPAKIATRAWYDASDSATITASNGKVSQWNDKSGNGFHIVQDTTSEMPSTGTRTMNSLNSLDFDGGDFLNGTHAVVTGNPNLMVIVVRTLDVNVDGNDMITLLGSGAGGATAAITGGNGGYSWRFFNGYEAYGATNLGSAGIQIGVRSAGANYAASEMWLNGTQLSRAGGTGDANTSSIVAGIHVGGGVGGSMNGAISEVIVLEDATTETRQLVEGYLAHKWGLADSLPTHPHKSASPTLPTATATLDGTVSDPNADSLTTIWTVVSGPDPYAISITDSSLVDTSALMTTSGVYTLRLTADDGRLQSSDDIVITVYDSTPYNNWVVGGFSDSFTNTDSVSNPDGDMFNNLQEYAFGMDPTDPHMAPLSYVEGGELTQAGAPIAIEDGSSYLFVYGRRKDYAAAGLTYVAQFSADLQLWTDSVATPTLRTSSGSSGGIEVVSVPFPESVPVTGGGADQVPEFVRVSVDDN
ncbi:MAG: family 16 glycosylhydrolase [Verrucomicrobiae bacterium]|nr:family 16 glycosylhydrolase [Verrucomicrobiae bacterium]NNJ43673.1 family 16 glycosylhydrolase [Akkermansiaceae bacterium]